MPKESLRETLIVPERYSILTDESGKVPSYLVPGGTLKIPACKSTLLLRMEPKF